MADKGYINVGTVQTIGKFIMDRNETASDNKSLSYHRNGMFQTVKNTELFATNEPANLECITLPYPNYYGSIKLTGAERFLVFTGDNVSNSEIGIIDLTTCTYQKVVNSSCLNFRRGHNPITGALRVNADGEEEVIFVDGYNSDKFLNLSKIPYKYTIDETTTCRVKEFNDELDCDGLLLNPNISIPCLSITKGSSGSLPDGVYFLSVAYTINDVKFTDYMSKSLPYQINNKAGFNSLSVQLSNLDRAFDKYQLLLTGVVEGITTHKIIGVFSTSQDYVNISDWENVEYQDGIPSTELTNDKVIYDNTGIISSNLDTLFRADIKKKKVLNYQQQAFNIIPKYIVKQVPLKYYKEGGDDIGYFRNEIYRFGIVWYYKTGDKTKKSHISGPKAKASDLSIVTGKDKFEKDARFFYQVYNTASPMRRVSGSTEIVGEGNLGFWQSDNRYDDDVEIYGDRACTNIIDCMMPDEEKVPRYSVIDGEIYINIIGVRFEDIEHPRDEDGNYIEGLSHYEIVRSERDENNSRIVARGIVTNMGGYKNRQNREILYSNFPYNDLSPNQYLSKKQTYKKGNKERNFTPLDTFYPDKFTFYSPNGNYFGRRSFAGTYLQFETEESGTVEGYFEEPYKHPRFKLLTNFSLYVSLVIGAAETWILATGNKKVTKNQKGTDTLGRTQGTTVSGQTTSTGSVFPTTVTTFEENFLSIPRWRDDLKNSTPAERPLVIVKNALKTLISLGAFVFKTAVFASEVVNAIRDFSSYEQYARQYNSQCLYTSQKRVLKGNKRRAFLKQPFYLDNGIHSSGNYSINNGGRNSTVFMEIEEEVPYPVGDNSRKTMSQFGLKSKDAEQIVTSNSSVYYTSVMRYNPNQYGSLNVNSSVKIHTCPVAIDMNINDANQIMYNSPNFFGGDCIIAEQTHVNKCPLFKQNLSNTNFNDGIPYDYRLYNNIAYPRYWIDTTEYNMGELVNIFGKSKPTSQKLPNQKFNLDLPNSTKNEWIEKDQVFYLSVNGVIRYIAEVPYNISYRKHDLEADNEIYQPHYSDEQQDLSYIFRADIIKKPEAFLLDSSYRYLSQIYNFSDHLLKIPKIQEREENTVIYSLPTTNNTLYSNWRYFLPLNRFTFDKRDFGRLTGVHTLDNQRMVFLFSQAGPYVSPGRSVLELKDQTVVIGDGGVFAQIPMPVVSSDVAYGSNHDRYAFVKTQFGPFYVSEYQGKIFGFADKLEEITRDGWHKWGAEFLPLKFKQYFPEWEGIHNPLHGVGYQTVFDNIFETVYFIKKDYIPRKGVTLDATTQEFKFEGLPVALGDSEYFEDVSLTLSYAPSFKSFVSFHDWTPDGVIQQERHFSTVKDGKVWKHNVRKDLFCNFYGEDKPYQIGIINSTGQSVQWLQSVEIYSEFYKYKTNELDRYHLLNEFFDWALIYNSEQSSGLMKLTDASGTRFKSVEFPKIFGNHYIEIPYIKTENKYRFNDFYDYTKERQTDKQPIITKPNGVDFIINQPGIDFTIRRPPRFRHYWNNFWLSKEICGSTHIITKFLNTKLTYSPR